MARFIKRNKVSIGKAPGASIFIGQQKVDQVDVRLIDYDHENIQEEVVDQVSNLLKYKDNPTVTWVNLYGLHETRLINELGEVFDLHPLTVEDILNTGQRPKMEEYDKYMFFVLKMIRFDKPTQNFKSEQLSVVLAEKFLVTFQERRADVFEPLRNRIRKSKGRVRTSGADYLAYVVLDTIVDNYILMIGTLGEDIEDLENSIIANPNRELLARIYSFKQEISFLRKSIRPCKDLVRRLSQTDSEFIHDSTHPFLKDLLDLMNQAVETIDTYREMLSDHLDVYNSGVNNRLNEIMKVLTIFSVVFIPLTFIAGIYGTNFEYLPELKYKYSYFIFWGVLITTAMSMLGYFKFKKWL